MNKLGRGGVIAAVCAAVVVASGSTSEAQDRLKTMPGYDRYQKMSKELFGGTYKTGAVAVTWKSGGKAFVFQKDGKATQFDIASKSYVEPTEGKDAPKDRPMGKFGRGGVERGRQRTSAISPDGQFKAFYRDRNLWLSDAKGVLEMQITTDGNEKLRIKNGSASWVYGEELDQNYAMWWSPDSKRVAYYRFDESGVPDYLLALNQTGLMTKLDAEPYPKAGAPNPIVDLFVYEVASKRTTKIDIRDGKPFADDVVGHYAYNVSWGPDGKELHFNRTNRRQNIMEFVAAEPSTGKCRVIVREEWLPSWTENTPPIRYLKDNHRFIWVSERTGWKNFYLHNLDGKLVNSITKHEFEVANIVRIDEENGHLYYMARSGDNPMKLQLHRCKLDGTDDTRLTDPKFHHAVDLAPDGKHFIDIYQTHNTPPASRVVDDEGKVVAELATSDMTKYEKLGLKKSELLTYKAADGKTDLQGMLHFPSNFDPEKKYPLLVSVYAGPHTNKARETFANPNAMAEYGFLVAELDSRSAAGRGKKFIDAIYLNLGVAEIDDQAAGVKALWDRPYMDKTRVGMFGGSYGGYATIMCMIRHPDVFQAGVASSPVTDYRLYDSIYTERYMWLPKENKKGYDAGSAVVHAAKLKGRLMLFFGTADNNVHPSNSMQLIQALQRAGKSFDVQIGPDQGHTGVNQARMMEFFIENLVLRK
ncbi:MAG TPA: DPP IV N-terminal domain-containing protein [Gemmataceae bacterium]|nr:DPP IV N-terminal domain-containing protein [Gemmataceae bacterium]